MTKPVYVAITIDGDLRIGSLEQKNDAIAAVRDIHNKAGIIGSTTWFINEYDFHWTRFHPERLLDIYDSGDAIAIHDHQDTHYALEYSKAMEMMQLSIDVLRLFFDQYRSGIHIGAHRNGCAFQSKDIYKALEQIGYEIVSDVWPEMFWKGRIVRDGASPEIWRTLPDNDPDAITVDNRSIPLGVSPWRHKADNWMDYLSKSGPLLQLPITSMPLIDSHRIRQAVENSSERAIVVTDTHPYDLQDPATGNVSEQARETYLNSISWMIDEFKPHFIRVQDVENIDRLNLLKGVG